MLISKYNSKMIKFQQCIVKIEMQIKASRDNSLDFTRGLFIFLMIVFHVFVNFRGNGTDYLQFLALLRPTTFVFAFMSGLSLMKFSSERPAKYYAKKSLILILVFVSFNLIRAINEPSILNPEVFLRAILVGEQEYLSFEILLALGIITLFFPILKNRLVLSLTFFGIWVLISNIFTLPSYNFDIYLSFICGMFFVKYFSANKISKPIKVFLWVAMLLLMIFVSNNPNISLISITLGVLYVVNTISIKITSTFFTKPIMVLSYFSLFTYVAHIVLIKSINLLFPTLKSHDFIPLMGISIGISITFWLISLLILRLKKR